MPCDILRYGASRDNGPRARRTARGARAAQPTLSILSFTGPIYVTIVLGYLTTRFGLFAKPEMRVFGKFVLNLALPALLFNALSQRPLGEILNGGCVLVYMGGSLAVIALGWWWCRVYPIMAQAYGQENFSTAALLLATIASFFTLTDVLWAFHHFAYTL